MPSVNSAPNASAGVSTAIWKGKSEDEEQQEMYFCVRLCQHFDST
jgi:hypothetical protein